jgi:glycosyltransferase involved in cell wall biosynthesis
MPRLLIDATPVAAHAKGVGRYALNLCLELTRQLPDDWKLHILVNRDGIGLFPLDFRAELIPVRRASELAHAFMVLPAQADRIKPALLLKTAESAGLVSGVPTITVCHDIDVLIQHAQAGQPGTVRKLVDRFKRHYRIAALRGSEYVICNSAFTRQAVQEHYGIPFSRTVVARCAVDTRFHAIASTTDIALVRYRYRLGNFVLVFATGDPRENYNAFPRLAARLAQLGVNTCLLVAGLRRSCPYASDLYRAFLRLGLVEGQHFVLEEFLPESRFRELAELYTAADFYVDLSLHEGFGMQLLEAMACGTTCISSPRGALTEVGDRYVLFVEPANTEEVAQTIKRAYETGLHRRDKSEQLRYTRQFSWEKTGRVVSEVLQRVADIKPVGVGYGIG